MEYRRINMKKILVTGGCGFIGSNLVDLLVQDDENNVYVVDNLESGNIDYCNSKATYYFADIRDIFKNVKNIPAGLEDVEVIFHLAALARIQPSFERPVLTSDVNSQGTSIVCDYARHIGAKLIYAGSSSFYAGIYLNPYAFSKWQGEETCKLYSEVYGVSTAIARFFNVYGPRQPSEGPYATVVGIFEAQHTSGQSLTVTGDGDQKRDFTNVKDICSGLMAISKGEYKGQVFNLGTGRNHSINQLAALYTGASVEHIPQRPGEAKETLADISTTTKLTGWVPECVLEEYVANWLTLN